jgi:hypothetical protein
MAVLCVVWADSRAELADCRAELADGRALHRFG